MCKTPRCPPGARQGRAGGGRLRCGVHGGREATPESRELAILEGTAALARFRGDPQPAWNEKALAAFRRALALSDAGTQPLDRARAGISVASVLTDTARYAEAEPLLRQAMKLREAKLLQDDPAVAEALNNLAQLLKGHQPPYRGRAPHAPGARYR